MMDADALFIDTNVLIYATDPQSPFHKAATGALDQARSNEQPLCISQRIVREFLAAATRAALLGGEIAKEDILQNIAAFRIAFIVLDDTSLALDQLVELVGTIAIAGRQIHDANIVATMLVHGVRRLLTHNTKDFARYTDLIEVVPLESPKFSSS